MKPLAIAATTTAPQSVFQRSLRRLGTGAGSGSSERSHKRSRPNDAGDANGGDSAPGGIRQVARSMLRAHKLGVVVPLLYHADVITGVAMVEAVAGRSLSDLITAASAAEAEAELPDSAAGRAPLPQQQQDQEALDPGIAPGPGSVRAEAPTVAVAAEAGVAKPLPAELDRAATLLGRTLAVLHDGGQVHGHLSGEAVLIRDTDGVLVLTDFTRSYNTIVALDKAQDLAGLERALLLAAAAAEEEEAAAVGTAAPRTRGPPRLAARVFTRVLDSYRSASRLWSSTHNQLPNDPIVLYEQPDRELHSAVPAVPEQPQSRATRPCCGRCGTTGWGWGS
ncbi:hypothetical protein VOLCADRAFT_87188 [Volvox carteri f. nagariensis]|uniref:non-specific serine/threonine protein kinase n=1 Tax=Volvox carteri f. nagariensis TaxID=3068 RepID=D8TKE6_VOLCA|nr:uncharacterized protein VOLCADRAFT_87188 [Volvox carteri f. nagariensis]EFJ52235.1 hypothetical protein VOLCADRAFT_87188 [Volvox carteri f. nagariensis]|eukprot:XP_002947009.1 hypothetical protein VOLCADRAFT_87188 [Volvox carteri f. nagariensis]